MVGFPNNHGFSYWGYHHFRKPPFNQQTFPFQIPFPSSNFTGFQWWTKVMELQRPGWRQRATPVPEEPAVTAEELGCIVCIRYVHIYLMYIHTEMYVAAGDCCTCLILIFRRFEVQWWCLFGTKSLAMMKTLMISANLGIVLIVLPFSVIKLNSEAQWRFPIPSHSKTTNRNDGILK